jgi:hypothetical protein
MIRRDSTPVPVPRHADRAATSSRFVLARLQAAAHTSTSDYFRMREMAPWQAAVASRQSSRAGRDRSRN